MSRFPLALMVTFVVLASGPRSTQACATAPPVDASVDVLGEDAIIIWDPAARREQFIRRATFRSAADHFGFLVPTPTVPTLDEAPDALFDRLTAHIDPGEKETTEVDVAWTLFGLQMMGAADHQPKTAPVQVLAEARVAGYDAVSIRATDVDAVSDWLEDHGYEFRPALRAWLAVYVDQGWVINAFKIARPDDTSVVGSEAVRMTFDTPTPFFPYREPSDAVPSYGRRLRVFLLSPKRHEANPVGDARPARLEHAAPVGDLDLTGLDGVTSDGWLHVFTDTSPRRPEGGELTFAARPGPERRLPPRVRVRHVVIPIFLDVGALLALLAFAAIRLHRARRAS